MADALRPLPTLHSQPAPAGLVAVHPAGCRDTRGGEAGEETCRESGRRRRVGGGVRERDDRRNGKKEGDRRKEGQTETLRVNRRHCMQTHGQSGQPYPTTTWSARGGGLRGQQ